MMRTLMPILTTLALTGLATAAAAETAMEAALDEGAEQMTSEEISEQLADTTVTFEMASSGDRFLVYYDGDNRMVLRPVGGDGTVEGFYAVDAADHLCFGTEGGGPITLRCVNVLLVDGQIHKFELDGSLRGHVVEEIEGDIM